MTSPEIASIPSESGSRPVAALVPQGLPDLPPKVAKKLNKRRLHISGVWKKPLVIIGLTLIILWVLIMIAAPLISPYDPLDQSGVRLQAPSAEHLFGTDTLGRDVFSRVLSASRISIPSSILLVLFSVVIGSAIGAFAGYFGGIIDEIFMRVTDLVFAFPSTILAMVISAALGPSIRNAILALLGYRLSKFRIRDCRQIVRYWTYHILI
jgi:peptide/nickel transport system permease protein